MFFIRTGIKSLWNNVKNKIILNDFILMYAVARYCISIYNY